ncbi:MAG: DNA repair protein RecO [Clostridiaceae bacterium]|nr:DNA repair protein RecO [Clostridiaceae bacterium]
MALIKTKGLVIKEVPVSDTDKILTLITADYGKISVSARNARRMPGPSSFGTQVLTYGEYVLFRGKEHYSFNSCDVLANFYDLANDIVSFTHAAHMLDMAGDACRDPISSPQVLNALVHGLHALRKGRDPMLVSSAFAFKLMQITGYPPHITSCVSCGTKDMEAIYFSVKKCGLLCENCAKGEKDSIYLSNGIAKAIIYVMCAENSGVFSFGLSKELIGTFSDIALRYIESQLDKKYNKLDFLKELKDI